MPAFLVILATCDRPSSCPRCYLLSPWCLNPFGTIQVNILPFFIQIFAFLVSAYTCLRLWCQQPEWQPSRSRPPMPTASSRCNQQRQQPTSPTSVLKQQHLKLLQPVQCFLLSTWYCHFLSNLSVTCMTVLSSDDNSGPSAVQTTSWKANIFWKASEK